MRPKQRTHGFWKLPPSQRTLFRLWHPNTIISITIFNRDILHKKLLYLCANKASLQIDPINWTALTHDITQWSHAHAKFPPALSAITTKKFEQRILPTHSSRSVNTKNSLAFRSSNNFFHYYDYTFSPEDETNTMKTYVRNPNDLVLLSRINQHDRLRAKPLDPINSFSRF